MPEPTRRSLRASASAEMNSAGWVPLPPDPAVLSALGGGHTLSSAVADIIDNSVDAKSSRVRVRFITRNAELVAVQIRDDGLGMSASQLLEALRLGRQRDYGTGDIGHYGIGLKAASMRHAGVLRVYTTQSEADDYSVSAIELRAGETVDGQIGATVLAAREAERGYKFGQYDEPPSSGTVVEWFDLKNTSRATERAARTRWLEGVIEEVRSTLGLAFHRHIEQGDLRIELDWYEIDQAAAGIPRRVDPRNPFQYTISGESGYPRTLTSTTSDGVDVTMQCHILPPRGTDRMLGTRDQWQGLYVYRNDRLLTLTPTWLGLESPSRELRLARAAVDVTDDLLPHIRPLPEKNGVTLTDDVVRTMSEGRNDAAGAGLTDYLAAARSVWKESTRRSTAKPIVEIASGLPDSLIASLEDNLGWRANQDAVHIRWDDLPPELLFEIDLHTRTLLIDRNVASQLGGEESPGAHLLATVLHLLLESHFRRASHLRTSTHDHLGSLNRVLLTALLSVAEADITDPSDDPATSALPPASLQALLAPIDDEAAALPEALTEWTQERPEAPPSEPSGLVSDVDIERRPARERSSVMLASDDLEAFESYCAGNGIATIAVSLDRTAESIASSLALSLFGEAATDHDSTLAFRHDLPYTPDERERILVAYRGGRGSTVEEIARSQGRTPLSIAWHLLDSPKRPIQIDKRIRRAVRRRASASGADTPSEDAEQLAGDRRT